MPHVDARSLPLSGAQGADVETFETSLERWIAGEHDALAPIERTLLHAPRHALRAAAAVTADDAPDSPAIVESLRALEQCPEAPEREQRHVQAVRAWRNGDAEGTRAIYGAIVGDHPGDLVALRVANALDFRLGDRSMLRDRVGRVLPHWSADVPGFAHVVAMRAFHVLAHVYEMRGRAADGIALVERTRSAWDGNAAFARHILWHLAVFHVDQGDLERARAIYDDTLAPGADAPLGALVDASALLWRLELRGAASAARWFTLTHAWTKHRLRGARAFNVVHAVVAQVGARQLSRARYTARLLGGSNERREDTELATAFCAALIAFAHGDHGVAVDRIGEVRTLADRCGGSVAQCDLIHLTLIEAALRGALPVAA